METNEINEEVLTIFKYFGFTPRKFQVETVIKILDTFFNKRKKYVCLSAPTGSGKSLIGMVVAEYISRKYATNENVSEILIHTKTLQNQYENTFGDKLLNIKGAANYPCGLIQSTADDCIIKVQSKSEKIPSKCLMCPYRLNRLKVNESKHVVTNYTYYFISKLCTRFLKPRIITIFDESHLINDLYCGHVSVNVSNKILKAVHKTLLSLKEDESASRIAEFIMERIPLLNEENYNTIIREVQNELDVITANVLRSKAMDYYGKKDTDMYKKYNQAANRISNINFRIADYLERSFESVTDIVPGDSVKIQPIFIHDSFNKLINTSKFNMFMSATNNPEFLSLTLNIPKDEIEFIIVPTTFDKENKKVYFINHNSYNYSNMNNVDFLKDVYNIILDIITDTSHCKQKGVILTPNFKINEYLSSTLEDTLSYRKMIKVFTQKEGETLDNVLQNFMCYNKPSVLLSPSIWEGVSLDGDTSEYQIMVKAPYGFLGDKRVKYIFDNYKTVYSIQTLFKIIQGMGRSTRSINDKSVTYCLDAQLYNIFMSPDNVWKDEFEYDTV